MNDRRTAWFRAKQYGYGAGLPIAWQGWVLLAAYVGVIAGAFWLFKEGGDIPRFSATALFVIANIVVMITAARRTPGGWKWRWGGDS